jgi:hypothetical protein
LVFSFHFVLPALVAAGGGGGGGGGFAPAEGGAPEGAGMGFTSWGNQRV